MREGGYAISVLWPSPAAVDSDLAPQPAPSPKNNRVGGAFRLSAYDPLGHAFDAFNNLFALDDLT